MPISDSAETIKTHTIPTQSAEKETVWGSNFSNKIVLNSYGNRKTTNLKFSFSPIQNACMRNLDLEIPYGPSLQIE
jgi:hypothetical protein